MTGDNGSYVLDSGGRYHPPPESIIHYGPGYRPLCDDEDDEALYTDDPYRVAGCAECLDLAAENLADQHEHRNPRPHCGRGGW